MCIYKKMNTYTVVYPFSGNLFDNKNECNMDERRNVEQKQQT